MKKENFVMIMKAIEKQMEFDRKFESSLSKFFDDFEGFYKNKLIDKMIVFLSNEMNDENEWVEYFIYDLNWGKDWSKNCCKYEDGSSIDISTLEKLYDFLNKEEK